MHGLRRTGDGARVLRAELLSPLAAALGAALLASPVSVASVPPAGPTLSPATVELDATLRAEGNGKAEAVLIGRTLLARTWPAQIAKVRVDRAGSHAVAGLVLSGVKFHGPLDERGFLDENGLPERPWFKNQIYAPGAYTGYGVKTIPAVRESIEQKKWSQAEQGSVTVGHVLEKEAEIIEDAAKQLDSMDGAK